MNKQAIEAAARVIDEVAMDRPSDYPVDYEKALGWGEAILEAARPHIESELRQKIAAEIRAERLNPYFEGYGHWPSRAALKWAEKVAEGEPWQF